MSSLKAGGKGGTAKTRWRSLEELADAPELRELVRNEFPRYADEMLASTSRRGFLKLMGASAALAGMTSCRWPVEQIVPFANRPEGFLPGEPWSYATAMELDGFATGVLVTSYDGRPIKIEGNPDHPSSLGGTDPQLQASILGLYDPERSHAVTRLAEEGRRESSWAEFSEFASGHFDRLRQGAGRGLHVLSEASLSPSLFRLRRELRQAFPRALWHEYEPFSGDNEREGLERLFGEPYRTQLRLDRARVMVCFDADLFQAHPARVRLMRDFSRARRAEDGHALRLYAVESCHSLTGSLADHRIPVLSELVPVVLCGVAAELILEEGLETHPGLVRLRSTLEPFLRHPLRSSADRTIVRDLLEHRGRSILIAGPGQPPEIHALVHLLNHALGNVDEGVRFLPDPEPERPSHLAALDSLVTAMGEGEVDTLVVLGGNPVFNAPADLEFSRHLESVGTSIHLGLYEDETAHACHWHLPRAHFLESWSDARSPDGTASVVQPLVEPLWGGKTPAEVLSLILDDGASAHSIVRETFRELTGEAGLDERWRRALHDGMVPGTAWTATRPEIALSGWPRQLAAHAYAGLDPARGEMELVFRRDPKVHDGRFANNGWLQELPDPLTKLTWDNAVLLAPADAERFEARDGDVVRIHFEGRALEMPVLVVPGQAYGSVTVSAGYGRRRGGRVGEGVGFDVYSLRTTTAYHSGRCGIERTRRRHPLATTQLHWMIDALGDGERARRVKELAREVELHEYLHDPEHALHHGHHPPAPLWKQYEYEGHKWGMAIDLNACVGCGACVVACQAENNIPIVGKDEVARGHEMHWIRVDRYFSGDPGKPKVHHQPVTCHHCETAPCEQVCPVAATVHDDEGLNVMVYNRCIGTRYCSNNCPFKVRRFNWFNFHKAPSDLEKMTYNPEVTVRGRGVMEKCTFCLQRINRVKIRAKNEQRALRDGEIVPACAQACPAEAIRFGDLNDADSRVREDHEHARAYSLLDEIFLKPRTRYLARLRNTHVEKPSAAASEFDERRNG